MGAILRQKYQDYKKRYHLLSKPYKNKKTPLKVTKNAPMTEFFIICCGNAAVFEILNKNKARNT